VFMGKNDDFMSDEFLYVNLVFEKKGEQNNWKKKKSIIKHIYFLLINFFLLIRVISPNVNFRVYN